MTTPTYTAEIQQDGSWDIIRTEPYFMRLDERLGSAVQRTYYKLGLTEQEANDISDKLNNGEIIDKDKLV